MHLIRVAGAALNQTPLDWDGNRARILAALTAARASGVSVLCLPELCITGYGCEDAFHSPGVQRMAWTVLQELIPHTSGLVVTLGLPVRYESAVHDAAALAVDGRLAGIVCKQHLAGEGIHYEPRWFRPWPAGRREVLAVEGEQTPIGDLRFDCGGLRIGFEICEDAWVAQRPGARLATRGIDLILNPSASHFAFGKDEVRRRFVLEGSRAFGCAYVYANLAGNEAGRAIYDGGVLVAAGGRLLAAGRRFPFADFTLVPAVVDIDAIRLAQQRAAIPMSTTVDDRVACDFALPTVGAGTASRGADERDAWEHRGHVKEEEFTRAVALGLFDYARKSRSRGFVVSASGGADSSAVACLAAIAVRLAADELSVAEAARRLGHAALASSSSDPADSPAPTDVAWKAGVGADTGGAIAAVRRLIHASLTCVYQSTANSGPITRAAAADLAGAIGARFFVFDVDGLVRGYERLVSDAIGRPLSWETDDVALQNIQARARAPGVWMLANLTGALLVSTSNRSEAAVGYATMDGDTAGGIAPIAGIDKAYLRRWLVWLEHEGPAGLGPIPELVAVTSQTPTAELRPPARGQTDEADLMPYDVLDAVERLAIGGKQTPLEAWRQLRLDFPEHPPRVLAAWTERFYRLWSQNQWKRERYAPSFHLDDQNLDPKTWCRFPILSGGFARECAALRAAVEAEGDWAE